MNFISYSPPPSCNILFNIEKYYEECNTINNVAYTEDNIPVRTVYASPIPHFYTPSDVKAYFGKFGTVENVNIYSNKHSIFSFITFTTCEDAAKCLKHQKHTLNRKKLRVSIADSWHQPKDTVVPSSAPETDGSEPSTSTASPANKPNNETTDNAVSLPKPEVNQILYVLNDDCLMHIFSYLNLYDLVKIVDVCPRFRDVITILFKRYKNFDFRNVKAHKSLTLMESREILSNIGPYVHNIFVPSEKFNKVPYRMLEMIPKFCPNLEGLDLEGFYIHDGTLKKYRFLFRKLKSLDIGTCQLDDSFERHLSRAVNLEKLDISKNHDIRGSCFVHIRKLRHLNIEKCVNLQPKFFADICANVELEYLNISRVDRLTTNNVKEIVGGLKKLEHLVISNSYEFVQNFEQFGELESLKKLQVSFSHSNTKFFIELLHKLEEKNQLEFLDLSGGNVGSQSLEIVLSFDKLEELNLNYNIEADDDFIRKLGKKMSRLRRLHLCGNTSVTDEGLLSLLDRCAHIEMIDMSHCFGLTDTLIIGAIDILKKRVASLQKPVLFLIGGTSVSSDIVESAKLLENTNLLKVSFEKTFDPNSFIDGIDDYDCDDYDSDNAESDYDFDDEDMFDIENHFWNRNFWYDGSSDDNDDLQEYYPWFF